MNRWKSVFAGPVLTILLASSLTAQTPAPKERTFLFTYSLMLLSEVPLWNAFGFDRRFVFEQGPEQAHRPLGQSARGVDAPHSGDSFVDAVVDG